MGWLSNLFGSNSDDSTNDDNNDNTSSSAPSNPIDPNDVNDENIERLNMKAAIDLKLTTEEEYVAKRREKLDAEYKKTVDPKYWSTDD